MENKKSGNDFESVAQLYDYIEQEASRRFEERFLVPTTAIASDVKKQEAEKDGD